jgi:hypothetical protein
MIRRKEILAAVVGVLASAATLRAEMMPVSLCDSGARPWPCASVPAEPPSLNSPSPFVYPSVADLDLLPVESLPAAHSDIEGDSQAQPVPTLSDGQNSFDLCLYALLGLGLCKSVPLVKRFSFSHIPQWYHDGGPAQIGHSFAISPDCLGSAPVCFVQPDGPAEEHIPRHFFATVVSLWRNSQFTPAILASRGPPIRMS